MDTLPSPMIILWRFSFCHSICSDSFSFRFCSLCILCNKHHNFYEIRLRCYSELKRINMRKKWIQKPTIECIAVIIWKISKWIWIRIATCISFFFFCFIFSFTSIVVSLNVFVRGSVTIVVLLFQLFDHSVKFSNLHFYLRFSSMPMLMPKKPNIAMHSNHYNLIRTTVGWSVPLWLMVWIDRHECNIANIKSVFFLLFFSLSFCFRLLCPYHAKRFVYMDDSWIIFDTMENETTNKWN